MKDSLLDRHPDKILPEPTSGCWLWTAAIYSSGYGRVCFRGKSWLAHRASYTISCGEIPKGLFVCHKCDIKCCVNPDHLFVGTHADNMHDRNRKGRFGDRSGESHGLAKLNNKKVLEIRKRFEGKPRCNLGPLSNASVGREYGVSETTIRLIRQRLIWDHI